MKEIDTDSFKGIHKKPSTYIGLLIIVLVGFINLLFQDKKNQLLTIKEFHQKELQYKSVITALKQRNLLDSIKRTHQIELSKQKQFYQKKIYQADIEYNLENQMQTVKKQLLVDYADIDLSYPFNDRIDGLDMNRVKTKMILWYEFRILLKKSNQIEEYQDLVNHIYTPRFKRKTKINTIETASLNN